MTRSESVVAYATALVTVVWLVVALIAFDASGDLVLGAMPALIAAVVMGVLATIYSRQKKLVWK